MLLARRFTLNPVLVVISLVFFFAMVGARAAADIRDLPTDATTSAQTLPKVYGIGPTSWILPLAVTVAAAISVGLGRSNAFDSDYIFWTLVSFTPAVVMAWSFPFRPTPNYAFILVWPYWGVGVLYMLALLMGST